MIGLAVLALVILAFVLEPIKPRVDLVAVPQIDVYDGHVGLALGN